MTSRTAKVFSLVGTPVDAIVLKNGRAPFIDESFFYLTTLDKGVYEGCLAVAYPDGRVEAIVSELEEESAKRSNTTLAVYRTRQQYEELVRTSLASKGTIGFNASALSVRDLEALKAFAPSATFVDVSTALADARVEKDDRELESIEKACSITDQVMEGIVEEIDEGMTEHALAAEIDYHMAKAGADGPAFSTIASFGANTAEPHYSHGEATLKRGDFVLCDFGAQYRRYASDSTRTWVYGKPTAQQKKMHEVVLAAQQVALDTIAPGVTAGEVDEAVRKSIDATEFKGRFIHSTGHALGLSVHDGPRIATGERFTFTKNMVFTVEPGVYLPGTGGVRTEDDIVVTGSGVRMLTKSPKDLIIF